MVVPRTATPERVMSHKSGMSIANPSPGSTTPPRVIEVFRPGTFTPMGGVPITFSADDLRKIASAYDAAAPAPAVIGHPAIDAPAYGWASRFRYDDASERLLAEFDEVEPSFAEAVSAGRFKKVSMAFFAPDASNNPKPGGWYPRHVGFLGAAAPAVPGLRPVSFAGNEGVAIFEFADAENGLREVAGALRSMREWLIGKFGKQAADDALPGYHIDWINNAAERDAPDMPDGPGFAAPARTPNKEQPPMSQDQTPEFKAMQAEIAEYKRKEREAAALANAAFADALVAEGKIIPASKARIVGVLDALVAAPAEIAFADGGETRKEGALGALKAVLQDLPKVVPLGGSVVPPEGGASVAFATADGAAVDPASLALHSKAIAYQAEHPNTDYMAAVLAVQSR